MGDAIWEDIASEAIDYLIPYSPVIMMGLENASRMLGRHIDRKEFVNAKSVYAVLKTTFEREESDSGRQLLEQFIGEPDRHRNRLVRLVAQKAGATPKDLGHKLIAITNRWREHKRPLP